MGKVPLEVSAFSTGHLLAPQKTPGATVLCDLGKMVVALLVSLSLHQNGAFSKNTHTHTPRHELVLPQHLFLRLQIGGGSFQTAAPVGLCHLWAGKLSSECGKCIQRGPKDWEALVGSQTVVSP